MGEDEGLKNPGNLFDDYDEHDGGDAERDLEPDEEDEMDGYHIDTGDAGLALEPVDDSEFTADDKRVPEFDDDIEVVDSIGPAAYASWGLDDTFVISGPTNPRGGMGRLFPDAETAERWCKLTYGRVVENLSNKTPNRWCCRVLKPTAPGGRYTPPPPNWLVDEPGTN